MSYVMFCGVCFLFLVLSVLFTVLQASCLFFYCGRVGAEYMGSATKHMCSFFFCCWSFSVLLVKVFFLSQIF